MAVQKFLNFKNTDNSSPSIPNGSIYHLGVQGNPGSSFRLNDQTIILGPAGQWEIYSEDLKKINLSSIKLAEGAGIEQIIYIEYEDESVGDE